MQAENFLKRSERWKISGKQSTWSKFKMNNLFSILQAGARFQRFLDDVFYVFINFAKTFLEHKPFEESRSASSNYYCIGTFRIKLPWTINAGRPNGNNTVRKLYLSIKSTSVVHKIEWSFFSLCRYEKLSIRSCEI